MTTPAEEETPMSNNRHQSTEPGVVFIVDDEEMVTTSIQTMLELETEHRVFAYNHPKTALEAAKTHCPDVIISDFLMPEMDGIAFLKAVKGILPESTLILLTGYADKENAIAAINAVGIYKYIEKPWDNETIKLSISNGLERSRLLGDLRQTIAELTAARNELQSYSEQLEALVEERTADLRVTYQKLESIVRGTADGILTLDRDLAITSINPAAQEWLFKELGMNTFIGADICQVLTLPDRKELTTLFTPNEPRMLHEALIGTLPVEVNISALPESNDGLSGYVVVIRDISRRKEIDRLRDDFVSTLTHDLRTPLLAAIQTLGFLEDGSLGPLTDKQLEIIQMMIQSNRDLLGLVNALLEVYKYESGRQRLVFDAVNLRELLEGICKELDALAQTKQQRLYMNLPLELPPVRGDKQELRRVFINLVGNAIHHSPAGGRIEVFGQSDASMVTIHIQDDGRGIPAEDIPRLFQRFSQGTSKVRSSGTGLGLYLSRQIIEAHQGTIGVESEEGKGACFSLTLPVIGRMKTPNISSGSTLDPPEKSDS